MHHAYHTTASSFSGLHNYITVHYISDLLGILLSTGTSFATKRRTTLLNDLAIVCYICIQIFLKKNVNGQDLPFTKKKKKIRGIGL